MNLMMGRHHIGVQHIWYGDLLDDEINDLVLEHRFRMNVGDQERDVVTLGTASAFLRSGQVDRTYRDGFPAQHDEALRALHHEAREFVA